MRQGPRMKPSNRFLVVSLVIAFPLLVLAFGEILSVFVVRPLVAILGPPVQFGSLVAVITWLVAAFAALCACRLVVRSSPCRSRDRSSD